jgi:hypothetical protein
MASSLDALVYARHPRLVNDQREGADRTDDQGIVPAPAAILGRRW